MTVGSASNADRASKPIALAQDANAFTLIELLVVIAIIAVLAALLNNFLWDDRWPSGITPKDRALPGPGDYYGFTLITGYQYH
jgi:prepilin-type N-terminal cleavage/methylation domain-containing protein